MPPNPKKRKTTSKRVSSLPVHTQKSLVEWGEKVDASNLDRGLLSLPVELRTEILDYFPTIGPYTASYHNFYHNPVLPAIFLVRVRILRALSQVCIDYRRGFLPLLWDSFNLCFKMRQVNPLECRDIPAGIFYKPVCDAQIRKFDGILANPNLASYIGTVRIILMPYHLDWQNGDIIPKFALFLSSLPNLHTLQVLHADSMTIKDDFQGFVFPKIRTLIIPGNCYEILKCCPQVTKVWCNSGWGCGGSKLVTVIAEYCKEVQEMRGFDLEDEKMVKRMITAAPNLRVLEIGCRRFEPIVDALPFFKDINTIIINEYRIVHSGANTEIEVLNRCIGATKQALKNLARASKERKYIRVWHGSNDHDFQFGYLGRVSRRDKTDINTYVRDYYSEVPI